MGYSPKWVAENPAEAAKLLDLREAQIKEKFFRLPDGAGPYHAQSMPPEDWEKELTPEKLSESLELADAIDYSFAYLQWVHTIKFLAAAYRRAVKTA